MTTPFLTRQSEVLTKLVNGIGAFSKQLKDARQQSLNKGEKPNKPEQEINEEEQKNAIVKFDPRDQKLIMSEHKDMQKYLKMLVNVVTNIKDEKINTVGFEQDSRKARAIAKKLKKSIEDLFKILNKAKQEKRKGLEFNESILREEIKPRTQLTRDQIIGFMEKGYNNIVDYMTEIERETIDKKESIDIDLTTKRIEKLNQVFNEILPYFPSHAPFGKEGNLGQIKKQVRQISRDIIQIIKQSKNLVERPDDFDEKAISRFDSILKASIVKLSKYFDLEIDDKEVKAMLPKIPPAKSASYGKDSEGIFNKIQDLIKVHSPKAKKLAKKISKKYSPEIRKALKKGMGWAKQYAKTLGEKAKPYLDKVKKAFAKVGALFNKYVDKYLAKDINTKLDDNDINEISKSLEPGVHNSVFEKAPEVKGVESEDDEPEEQKDLEKYYDVNNKEVSIERQKDILESFFQQMKGEYMTEVKVLFSKQLQQQGIDRNTAIKASNSYKKIKDEFLPSEQKWLKKTLIKMAKEDRDLFMKSAGRDRVNSPESGNIKDPSREKETEIKTTINSWLDENAITWNSQKPQETIEKAQEKFSEQFSKEEIKKEILTSLAQGITSEQHESFQQAIKFKVEISKKIDKIFKEKSDEFSGMTEEKAIENKINELLDPVVQETKDGKFDALFKDELFQEYLDFLLQVTASFGVITGIITTALTGIGGPLAIPGVATSIALLTKVIGPSWAASLAPFAFGAASGAIAAGGLVLTGGAALFGIVAGLVTIFSKKQLSEKRHWGLS